MRRARRVPVDGAPHPAEFSNSKIELECQLDLSRIVRTVARRRDFCEVLRIREIADARRRIEARRREIEVPEIGMIGKVEEFGAEFQMRTFRGTELLEEGPIQTVKTRPYNLGACPS